MRVGLVHNYQLLGSGSCVYVRQLAAMLAELGDATHVVSAEPQPERYPCIRLAVVHDGRDRQVMFERAGPPAKVVSHTFQQRIYPLAYARKEMQDAGGKLLVDFSDAELEAYVARNVRLLARLCAEEQLQILHVNHAVMLPYIARQVQAERGVPFVTTIHGSDLEYVVRRDPRFLPFAIDGLRASRAIIVLNPDGARRVRELDAGLTDRLVEIPGGVDTAAFVPLSPLDRARGAGPLLAALASEPTQARRGRGPDASALLDRSVSPGEIRAWVEETQRGFDALHRDADLPARLAGIAWERDPIVVFLGKLMVDKGPHVLLAAAPFVLQEFPEARFLFIGDGPFRAGLEALAAALVRGRGDVIPAIEAAMASLEPGNVGLQHLGSRWRGALLADYPGHLLRGRVIFTGLLPEVLLCRLLPLAHVVTIPSLVPEALPLVFLEALASGVPPVCAEAGGLVDMLERLAAEAGELDGCLSVRPDPASMVADLADRIRAVLRRVADPETALVIQARCRGIVEKRYSWGSVARRVQAVYRAVAGRA